MARRSLMLALVVALSLCCGAQARRDPGSGAASSIGEPAVIEAGAAASAAAGPGQVPLNLTSIPEPSVMPVAPISQTAAATATCVDTAPAGWCPQWRDSGYCSGNWVYQDKSVATVWCPLTCNTCSCSDRLSSSQCSSWKSKGYCAAGWFYQSPSQPVGTYWCRNTCGQCGSNSKCDKCNIPVANGGCKCDSNCDCITSPSPQPRPSPSPSPAPGDSWQVTLLNLVNNARRQAGLPALCLNSLLTAAAQAHSQDQANRRTMSHIGGDGSTLGDRLTRIGYVFTTAGENVAWNYPDVTAVFNGWWNSPGHRANILGAAFRHMGAGRADSNGPYWTQVFGASSSQGCS